MRKRWKTIIGLVLLPFSHLGWILDQIGRAQTVKELPILSWIFSPYFSPVAFTAAAVILGWAYYDMKIHKQPAGFGLDIEQRSRIKERTILVVVTVILIFVGLPLV